MGRKNSFAQISVRDSGEGISLQFLPYVFDRFKQADASTTRKHGGLGLGLAITRHLAELHGGTIEAESEGEGLGATFTVSLPLTAVVSPVTRLAESESRDAAKDTSGISDLPNLAGIKILAIEDDADARELLRVVLEGFGADVATASSAREGLEVMAGWRPDVIVSDIGMPAEDGYSFIEEVRKLKASEGGNTPAIALTGFVRLEERMRALRAGYQMFVPKPVHANELGKIIATLVGRVNEGPESHRAVAFSK